MKMCKCENVTENYAVFTISTWHFVHMCHTRACAGWHELLFKFDFLILFGDFILNYLNVIISQIRSGISKVVSILNLWWEPIRYISKTVRVMTLPANPYYLTELRKHDATLTSFMASHSRLDSLSLSCVKLMIWSVLKVWWLFIFCNFGSCLEEMRSGAEMVLRPVEGFWDYRHLNLAKQYARYG